MKAREFTSTDWYGWCSAEPWDNDNDPVIRYLEHGVVVADKSGMSLSLAGPDEDAAEFMWNTPLATQALAMVLLNGFDENITVADAEKMGLESC